MRGFFSVATLILAAFCTPLWGFSVDDVPVRIRQLQDSRYVVAASAGASAEGRQILYLVITDPETDHRGKLRVMLISGQHGNELASVDGVLQTAHFLAFDKSEQAMDLRQRTIFVIAPLVNPDGAENGTRTSGAGVDLNRDWIKKTQPEVCAVRELVDTWKPAVLMDEHQWLDGDLGVSDFIETDSDAAAAIRKVAMAGGRFSAIKPVSNTSTANPALAHRFFSSQGIPSFLIESRQAHGRDYDPQVYQRITLALVDSALEIVKPTDGYPWRVPALLGKGPLNTSPVVYHPGAVGTAFVLVFVYLLMLASAKAPSKPPHVGKRPSRRMGRVQPRREHDLVYWMSRPKPGSRAGARRNTTAF